MTTTAPDLTGLRTWISGTAHPATLALLRDLGALTLTRADVLAAEHFDDEVEAAQACADTLLTASVLVHDGHPDPDEVLLAEAVGLRVLYLS